MSTSYYNFAPPIGGAYTASNDAHTKVRLFDTSGEYLGELTFSNRLESGATDFLMSLKEEEPVVRRVGLGAGQVAYSKLGEITSNMLISEYGELVSATELTSKLTHVLAWRKSLSGVVTE